MKPVPSPEIAWRMQPWPPKQLNHKGVGAQQRGGGGWGSGGQGRNEKEKSKLVSAGQGLDKDGPLGVVERATRKPLSYCT